MLDLNLFTASSIPTAKGFAKGYKKDAVEQKLNLIQQEYNRLDNVLAELSEKYSGVCQEIGDKTKECLELEKENDALTDEIKSLKRELEELKESMSVSVTTEPISNEPSYNEPSYTFTEPEPTKSKLSLANEPKSSYEDEDYDEDVFVGEIEDKTVNEPFRISNEDIDNENDGFNFL